MRGHSEVDLPPAAIDQRTGSNDARASLFHNANGFLRRATGSPHVLNDKNMLVGSEREPSSQRHHAAAIALHKECGRSPTARTLQVRQRPCNFLTDDEPAG